MDLTDLYRELNELRRDFGNRIGEILKRLDAGAPAAPADPPPTRKPRRNEWTPEQVAILTARWPDPSISVAAIAALIGKPAPCVMAKRQNLGLPGRTFKVRAAGPSTNTQERSGTARKAPGTGKRDGVPDRGAVGAQPAAPPQARAVARASARAPYEIAPPAAPARPVAVAAHLPVVPFADADPVSVATVCQFLRRRDFQVKAEDGGMWVLDGRRRVDRIGLLEVANRHREKLRQPPFVLQGDR